MNLLVIGSGGREAAITSSLSNSPSTQSIYICPGNGGTESTKVKNVSLTDTNQLLQFAQEKTIDLVIVGPEQPLVEGIQSEFKKVGIPVFGPSKEAARMEGSKAFSKEFMKKFNIPTAEYHIFTEYEKAKDFLSSVDNVSKWVIKASGLAAGKGVLLPESRDEALLGLKSIMLDTIFGNDAGAQVVIEERLVGEEVSVLAFTDGYTIVPLPAAQDHKRALDGDLGLNTGGMGAYAPAPIYTSELSKLVHRTILQPTVDNMRKEGYPFVGILYTGLMLTLSGPKVLEYNVRFGDPETQVLLPLLDDSCDLAQIMLACAEHRLDSVKISFKKASAATVVIASQGYPESYPKGLGIQLSEDSKECDVTVFHAGTRLEKDGRLVTSGGRVLAVTAVKPTLDESLKAIYDFIPSHISIQGMHYRRDIGHRALNLLKSSQCQGLTYEDAGVSIDAGNLLVEKIKPLVKATRRLGAEADLGGFGGLFDLKAVGYKDPILVSGTDGVGTKLKIAQAIRKHDTIGVDLVAMNVNDVLVQGAEPLFFLDYFASSKLEVDVARDVIKGICDGCKESACALVGGETAEMPGIYENGDYDLAGFVIGAVERSNVLPVMESIRPGDVVLGLPSSGVHSNGFSLVRRVVALSGYEYTSPCPFPSPKPEQSLGEALLTPTRIYVKTLLPIIKKGLIKSMAHITGGGFPDNIPRALPDHLGVDMDAQSWELPHVFKWLKSTGNISNEELSRTFNCGIGMVLILSKENALIAKQLLANETVYDLGVVFAKESVESKSVIVRNMEKAWK